MSEEHKKSHGRMKVSPERRREIASMGGKASQQSGKAHRFTSETAREAGRIGGSKGGRWKRRKIEEGHQYV